MLDFQFLPPPPIILRFKGGCDFIRPFAPDLLRLLNMSYQAWILRYLEAAV